jgi:hypothetical protein
VEGLGKVLFPSPKELCEIEFCFLSLYIGTRLLASCSGKQKVANFSTVPSHSLHIRVIV